LDLADFKINVIKYERESIKLKSLIIQAFSKGLILYDNYNFLSYFINIFQSVIDFFNLFIRFLAKLTLEINKEIINPIF